MTIIRSYLLAAGLLLACATAGQDVDSGPEIGKQVPALKVFDATGSQQNKELDYAAERKDKPTLYVFIQADKWDRPMARFLKKLDENLLNESEEAYIVATWLTDDVDKTKEYLPRAQQSLKFQNAALTCFPGEKTGPKDWGINSDAHLTAVVACKGRVMKKFGFQSINETDAPTVREALNKGISGK